MAPGKKTPRRRTYCPASSKPSAALAPFANLLGSQVIVWALVCVRIRFPNLGLDLPLSEPEARIVDRAAFDHRHFRNRPNAPVLATDFHPRSILQFLNYFK